MNRFTLIGLIGISVLLNRVVFGQNAVSSVRLLEGYQVEGKQGEDTKIGRIWKAGSALSIDYDIGILAGVASSRYPIAERKWIRRQSVGNRQVIILLTNKDRLVVSFCQTEDAPPANFFADIRNPADIAEVLLMVLTYRYVGPQATTQASPTPLPITLRCTGANKLSTTVIVSSEGNISLMEETADDRQRVLDGRLTPEQRAELEVLFRNWHELQTLYTGNGPDHPEIDITYGGMSVITGGGGNPPQVFQDIAKRLFEIAESQVVKPVASIAPVP